MYYHDRKNRNDVLHFPKSGYSQFQSSIFIRPFENGILREDVDCIDIFDIPFEKKEPIVMVLKEYYNRIFLKLLLIIWRINRGKK